MKPNVYTSTKMEDQIKDGSKTFFNLKMETFKCSNPSKKIIVAFKGFFFLPQLLVVQLIPLKQ